MKQSVYSEDDRDRLISLLLNRETFIIDDENTQQIQKKEINQLKSNSVNHVLIGDNVRFAEGWGWGGVRFFTDR